MADHRHFEPRAKGRPAYVHQKPVAKQQYEQAKHASRRPNWFHAGTEHGGAAGGCFNDTLQNPIPGKPISRSKITYPRSKARLLRGTAVQ